jgi:hypothetical protein
MWSSPPVLCALAARGCSGAPASPSPSPRMRRIALTVHVHDTRHPAVFASAASCRHLHPGVEAFWNRMPRQNRPHSACSQAQRCSTHADPRWSRPGTRPSVCRCCCLAAALARTRTCVTAAASRPGRIKTREAGALIHPNAWIAPLSRQAQQHHPALAATDPRLRRFHLLRRSTSSLAAQ